MGKRYTRSLAVVLAICLLLSEAPVMTHAANPGGVEYVNTYKNTGNQRQDILGVAMTQLNYREGTRNDTRFGDWCGYPHQPWCAAFVSWCAKQAEIGGDVLKKSARAKPAYFNVPCYAGTDYTPKPGDLFFTAEFTHVGLVLYVDGEFFYCIEGNGEVYDTDIPRDPEEDSYHVVINKRRIATHHFGVPPYKGGDKAHNYVRGYDTAHPHNVYYKCTDCGSSYYNGQTEIIPGCGSCYHCGCNWASAGYYLISISNGPLKVRTGHSASASHSGYVSDGAVVYVYGKTSSWAYVEYDGLRGHIPVKYLKKYMPPPTTPQLRMTQTEYLREETAVLSWTAPAGTEQYRLEVYRDQELYLEKKLAKETSLTMEALPAGEYIARVIACNRAGASQAGTFRFAVRDTYTVTYDLMGGTGGPSSQTQTMGEGLVLSDVVPRKSGYTFLGWTEDSQGKMAVYDPGAAFRSDDHVTLYAVWKRSYAPLQSVTLEKLPARRVFLQNESLDTTGLSLAVTYTDGSGHRVSQGYTTEGFQSDSYGRKTVTVNYNGFVLSYEVEVAPYIPGDMDDNRLVNRDDVMQLLWHISFPSNFPLDVPVDLNNDKKTDRDDVMQLLWHVSFPDQFPLDVIYEVEK